MVWGSKRYVTNVCMYAALFHLYSGIITLINLKNCKKKPNLVPCGASRYSHTECARTMQSRKIMFTVPKFSFSD